MRSAGSARRWPSLLTALVPQAAAVAGHSALSRTRRTERVGGRERRLPAKCAASQGYNLHGGVVVGARDRAGLERLCRYVNRPALGVERLTEAGEGLVRVALKTPWSGGTSGLLLTPAELVEKLIALVPPARANQVFYHGALGARSSLRKDILPKRRRAAPEKRSRTLRRGPRWATGWVSQRRGRADPEGSAECVRAIAGGEPVEPGSAVGRGAPAARRSMEPRVSPGCTCSRRPPRTRLLAACARGGLHACCTSWSADALIQPILTLDLHTVTVPLTFDGCPVR